MFTGIVTHRGTVERIEGTATRTLEIAPIGDFGPVALGASIAHSGVCLTVAALTERGWRIDASPETLARTTIGDWRPGTLVNLERALRLGDELGGHLVFGHVDAIGTVLAIDELADSRRLVIGMPAELAPMVAVKGSIALDGVSLTVSEVGEDRFATVIVPHTWKVTTLSERKPGDRVNLEVDMLARYVARWLACSGGASRG
ncbi:MAG: riboflavin synthase [Geminicoccaceae bacterium]|nr:riboflavin synthase [Geminicoccaceae bacterium]MCS7266588.1 riboflavin synthase [Geminicoccaceae bacterium]MCX7630683.1 riboflavin synthase [Geminicoccaceae bacterium]MDW8123221.1 riboflavin synthase [Geminicoccaceae bacterium]MDW8340119.1 riboflavin synthase [Geminicoccaceae bacterium]